MTDIIPTLRQDEYAVLMALSEGGSIAPIGSWKDTLESLVKRGFARMHDSMNSVITSEGRAALDAYQNQEARDLIEANNRLVEAKQRRGLVADASVGPHNVNGYLFFKMLDGSSIQCTCIGEPYVSEIVEMWNRR